MPDGPYDEQRGHEARIGGRQRHRQQHRPVRQVRPAKETDQQRRHRGTGHRRQQDTAKTFDSIHAVPYARNMDA